MGAFVSLFANWTANFFNALDLSTREQAVLIWVTAVLAFMLIRTPQLRQSSASLISTVFGWILLRVFLAAILYIAAGVWILYRAGFWDIHLLKITVLWFFGASGMAAGMNFDRNNPVSFKRIILGTLALSAVLEFVVSLYSFPLPIELVLVPVLFLLVGSKVIAEKHPDFVGPRYEPLRKFLSGILVIWGLIVMALTVRHLVTHFAEVATVGKVKEFFPPVVLTIWFVPFAYMLQVYTTLETAFLPLRWRIHDPAVRSYTQWRLLRWSRLSLRRARFINTYTIPLESVGNRDGIDVWITAMERAWREPALVA